MGELIGWERLFDWLESARGTNFLDGVRVGRFSVAECAAIAAGCGLSGWRSIVLFWKVCLAGIEELAEHPERQVDG